MKQYDKNSLIGFVLMAVILVVFNTFFFPEVPQEQDSTTATTEINPNKSPSNEATITPIINDTTIDDKLKAAYGVFANSVIGEETFHTIENNKLKITVSNKGGRIISVIMKGYQTYDSLTLDLFNADSSHFNLQFTTGQAINTADLFFIPDQRGNSLSMRLKADNNHYIEYIYTLKDDYLVDFDINLVGMETLIPIGVNYINLEWQMKTPQTEKSKSNQDMYTGIQYQYSSDDEVDYLSFSSTDDDEINARLNWVAFKQQFFSAIFIAKDGFEKPTNFFQS